MIKTCVICGNRGTKHNRLAYVAIYSLTGATVYNFGNVCKTCRQKHTKPGDWLRFDLNKTN